MCLTIKYLQGYINYELHCCVVSCVASRAKACSYSFLGARGVLVVVLLGV